ncbi:arginase family protein [Candidatus Woesearchaeota archaeon]|nr:arginase family protein [Candidatus Woesearchaeota archaeon]
MSISRQIKLILIALLFTALLVINAQKNEKVILWINLQKETNYYDDLEYGQDVAMFLNDSIETIGKKFEINSDDFSGISLSYLKEVYSQNPHPKTILPSELLNYYKANIATISYNLTKEKDHSSLDIHFEYMDCLIIKTYSNLDDKEMYYITENFVENITRCIANSFIGKQTDVVFAGTDHAISLLTFKAAKIIEPKSKIGLFVFDEHVDIYGLKDNENIVTKANVFGKLLLEGYVDYVVFIGSSEAAKSIIGTSADKNFTRKDIFDKISVYSDADLKESNFQHILNKEMNEMKKKGITNVMVSVDTDVLPLQYTGFEYSILAPAIGKIRHNGKNRTDLTLAEFQEGFSIGMEPYELKQHIGAIKYSTLSSGMNFGASNGSIIILGDIQELLPKQDINFETTKAAMEIVASLFG